MNRPEEQLQRTIADWLRLVRPDCLWWHTPNSGRRTKAEAGIFRALGVRPGVPDLLFVVPPSAKLCAIELKAGRGQLTEGQERFEADILRLGGEFALCHSLEEVQGTLTSWGVNLARSARVA